MPSLSEQERALLKIDDFIFHVVHHGEPEPLLLDATPIGDFEPFFLERVRETLRGNRFVFTPNSPTRGTLAGVAQDPAWFVEASKELARQFHSHDDQRIKRGVLIVMSMSCAGRRLFSLIKYDHERVLAFDLGDARAVLRSVVNTFTETPAALQKSALVELTEAGGDLVIIDRSKRAGITGFFQGFLGVQRRLSETEMTSKVGKVVLKAVQSHLDDLPLDVTARTRDRLAEIAERRPTFEADQFFGDFFGAHGTDAVRATYERQLEIQGVQGEAFAFDRGAMPRSGPRRYQTTEGVRLLVPEGATDTVTWDQTDDGTTVVTIRTRRLTEL